MSVHKSLLAFINFVRLGGKCFAC